MTPCLAAAGLARRVLAVAIAAAALFAASGPSFAQAPKDSTTRDLERINWMELREWLPSRSQTVLLPLGMLETHGPALPQVRRGEGEGLLPEGL